MDKFLLFSILLVFLGTFFTSVLQQRRKDRVLQDLDGFHVVARLGHKDVWGRFRTYPNAVELVFSRPYRNRRGKTLTSFTMFADTMQEIDIIFRFHDELSPENQQRRLKELEKVIHPGLLLRAGRGIRNFLVAFNDAVGQSIGMLLTRVQKHIPVKADEKQLQKIGAGAGTASLVENMAFEPALENYIARRVVVEMRNDDDSVEEYEGWLKEYSADWMSIVGCRVKEETRLPLRDASRLMLQRILDFDLHLYTPDNASARVVFRLELTNQGDKTISLCRIENDDGYQHPIGLTLDPGERVTVELSNLPEESLVEIDPARLPLTLPLVAPERQKEGKKTGEGQENPDGGEEDPALPPLPDVTLVYYSSRAVDVYVPRRRGQVRHGSEYADRRRGRQAAPVSTPPY